MKRVALGLSGGVDSAVAAHLLRQLEYEVHCIYLNCFDEDVPGCRTKEDRKDALAVALHLGLPFQVLDFRKEYQQSVIEYFKSEYETGRTPNPDVVCNRDIKFGLFWDWALRLAPLAQGKRFDYIATGHYAKLQAGNKRQVTGNRKANKKHVACCLLHVAKDSHKDQTYFLWQVPRERFERVLFPLGDYLKSEVREIAREAKLPVSEKKDSTGICFIGEVRVEDFLKQLGVKEHPGEVVDTSGNVIGKHRGVIFYTVGQRHGFEVTSKLKTPFDLAQGGQNSKLTDKPPLYVIEKDVEHNRLVVGFGAACFRSQFSCGQLNWMIDDQWLMDYSSINHHPSSIIHCFVRIRHGGELIPASLEMVNGRWLMDKRSSIIHHPSSIRVRLREPQRGIAPGQSAVFYVPRRSSVGGTKAGEEMVVLGGGIIW